jgi:hypothetical protein
MPPREQWLARLVHDATMREWDPYAAHEIKEEGKR